MQNEGGIWSFYMNGMPTPDVNAWYEEELRQQYRRDPASIDADWKKRFEQAPSVTPPPSASSSQVNGAHGMPAPGADAAEMIPLRGGAARIAENMTASLAIPLASSQRIIPVRVLEENRRRINRQRELHGASKISFTHLIGWAIIRSVVANPALNHAFVQNAAGEAFRAARKQINFGLAVDVTGRNGARSLMVPNIRNAGALDFAGYQAAFDDLVTRARSGKLSPADMQGTTISLTNPGTVGTMASSPRLMPGQGAIIAVGAIDYPAEYRGVAPAIVSALSIGKVMSVTCTYDHRIIQGAESGIFLGKLQALLDGEDGFYEEVFEALQIPGPPASWTASGAASAEVIAPGEIPGGAKPEPAKAAAVFQLIHMYRVRGHLSADLDPLGARPPSQPELDPATYGLTAEDLHREFHAGPLQHAFDGREFVPLQEMIDLLRATYCGKIGCEYMYIQRSEERLWLQRYMEPESNSWPLPDATKLRILKNTLAAEEFEHFLHRRFVGQKRFSLEGAETAVAILIELADLAAETDMAEIVAGMAHRGRLNVLANVICKPVGQIFSEFEGNDPGSTLGSGDVKYHLGASGTHKAPSGKKIAVSLAANPSHLEAVNPVVEGMVRARQDPLPEDEKKRVMALLIHGDAAFIGQGVVAETLNLSQLDGYSTGGTIHLVINNQIGFTTLPRESRSTPYATDMARMIQAPIFHVNGDDPEACIRVANMAFRYRQQFGRDVVIDMFCYRRHGHNEADDPAYTQPVLYRKIQQHASVATQYGKKMVEGKLLDETGLEALRTSARERLSAAFDANKAAGKGKWVVQPEAPRPQAGAPTSISREMLGGVVDAILRVPPGFHVHPKLDANFLKRRRSLFEKDETLDWAYAEAIAFGALVLEGTPVRLSGQDSGRGTFSQRHLALYDHENGERYIPLQHVAQDQARFDVLDSSLSEFAVPGFEYGYSVAAPRTLTLWEAQFGDFSNGAQIIIDQFITTAEQKWNQRSGLVLLLPHGYEGQGPEHSSARMERFLMLSGEENIRVANCSTPAQYFHILRRQVKLPLKPLVLFTPKSLLRSPRAASRFAELTGGEFHQVLEDGLNPAPVRRIVFCTGKVYYDLLAEREAKKIEDVALVRIEQLYPFPSGEITELLARYKPDVELIWAQEEPRNMGAWRFMGGRFRFLNRQIGYVGRSSSASPATGSSKRHAAEQARVVQEALNHGEGRPAA
jgi:2-oxoglutarate dehydrogenase E1 component